MASVTNHYAFICFVCGIVCGFMLFRISYVEELSLAPKLAKTQVQLNCGGLEVENELRTGDLDTRRIYQNDSLEYTSEKYSSLKIQNTGGEMYHNVRILCWIMTSPSNLDLKAVHVKATWSRRCDHVLFASNFYNETFPTINITVRPGRQHLTAKTMQTLDYIYKHHFNDADWFLKADDDTYVIMENLRYMLHPYDASREAIYFGHHFRKLVQGGYLSGGSGYVMSKESLRRFGERGEYICPSDGGAEDVAIGNCMNKLGVKIADSRDRHNRTRFSCFDLSMSLTGARIPKWYYDYDFYGGATGLGSVSELPISFHYVTPKNMYIYDYLVYHLRAYGHQVVKKDLNRDYVNYSLVTLPHLPTRVRRGWQIIK